MRHRKSGVRIGITLVVAGALSAIGLSTSSATPQTASKAATQTAAAPEVIEALQRDLGLSESQATARLRQEAKAAELEETARRAAGSAFGGAWFDAERGELTVGVADGARAGAVRATGARAVAVEHTLAELDSAKEALDAGAEKGTVPAQVRSWHVDPRAGSVVVDVRAGTTEDPRVRAFLDDARRRGPVTVEESDHQGPRTFSAGVVGGDPYYINGNTRCSIGFSVEGGFVSAGHCGGVGSSVVGWDNSAMGTFEGSSFPGDDYAFIRIGNGWWTEPVVLGWGTVSDVLVRGSQEAPVGASICRSGSTTHWHCGTLLAKNETVNYGDGAVVYELTKTSVCAEPGDSGGSFISGDQAQGVTSGGWGNCSEGGETWYQPVNEILDRYGLTLVTA
ncbi:S1 family peptidase [Streptomyces sp. TP-A0874]|uniref:S1 family peptidase n=1 Tax=Streptomyces sp. TP-A0874 TaxID=549819 RepID=UPI000AEC98E5|nr:S1 family peptidase [Streptomyces sp. TP-A0874]